jgi:hypothetical protein
MRCPRRQPATYWSSDRRPRKYALVADLVTFAKEVAAQPRATAVARRAADPRGSPPRDHVLGKRLNLVGSEIPECRASAWDGDLLIAKASSTEHTRNALADNRIAGTTSLDRNGFTDSFTLSLCTMPHCVFKQRTRAVQVSLSACGQCLGSQRKRTDGESVSVSPYVRYTAVAGRPLDRHPVALRLPDCHLRSGGPEGPTPLPPIVTTYSMNESIAS